MISFYIRLLSGWVPPKALLARSQRRGRKIRQRQFFLLEGGGSKKKEMSFQGDFKRGNTRKGADV